VPLVLGVLQSVAMTLHLRIFQLNAIAVWYGTHTKISNWHGADRTTLLDLFWHLYS